MLDCFEIFTSSGVVLWSKSYEAVSINIVNSLIKNVFIEQNLSTGKTSQVASALRNAPYKKDKYTLKWTIAKELGLIFVAVYHSLLQLSWVEKLLDNVKILFVALYGDQLKKPNSSVVECQFDDYFNRQVQELEITLRAMPNTSIETESTEDLTPPLSTENGFLNPPIPAVRKRKFTQPLSGWQRADTKTAVALAKQYVGETTSTDTTPTPTPDSSRPVTPSSGVVTAKGGPAGRNSRRARKAGNAPAPPSRELSSSGKPKSDKNANKKGRRWDENGMLDDSDERVLDYSTSKADTGQVSGISGDQFVDGDEKMRRSSWGRKTVQGQFVLKDLDEEMNAILSDAANTKSSQALNQDSSTLISSSVGAISGLFRNMIGGKMLTESDLIKPLKAMEDHLVRKNVARDAAAHLCTAVLRDLVGKKTPSFTSIDTALRTAMDNALSKILTPTSGSSLDLLRSIQAVTGNPSQPRTKPLERPYVISVVGVNGVGKSTTLAKLAHLLLHNNHRVLVAAADTFRSGAVEQLRVHVRRLAQLCASATPDNPLGSIDLYERGYGKDAAHIARDAIAFASEPAAGVQPFDVVLIDTAGRRHNDTRLMSSLAPFARAAQPDKILMVGEALVGTDSVAQARHFNEAFGTARDNAGPGARDVHRGLDGFIVSKCDTVGEMVGTLVSLVWSTGVPVVAVGVGQHYGDLRGFKVEWARSLLFDGL